jgi:hypothetical protein
VRASPLLPRIVVRPDNKLPADSAFLCHVLVVVLRRQCPCVLAHYFTPAGDAAEYPRVLRYRAREIDLVKRLIPRVPDKATVLVQRHGETQTMVAPC